jgi:hypothetical protein
LRLLRPAHARRGGGGCCWGSRALGPAPLR